MESSFETVIRALSWTFVHSLWIGLIAAFISGITIMATRKSSASLRYNILTSTLVLFLLSTTMAAIREFKTASLTVAAVTKKTDTGYASENLSDKTLTVTSGFINNAVTFFNNYAGYLMIVWLLVFAFKLTRLFYGISRTGRLRTQNLVAVPEVWKERIEKLKADLHIRKSVMLFESYLVKIPLTLGHLKPIILFPVGALTNMPPSQIEAVLLHELAHIRRSDYLINMLQLLIESVFFFNPCMLWISSQIRKERENCCDDLAITKLDSRKNFLTALLSFQELAFGKETTAQAFTGTNTLLLNRAQRIVYEYNSSLTKKERKNLFIALAFLGLLVFGSGNYNEKNSLPEVVKSLYAEKKINNPAPVPANTKPVTNTVQQRRTPVVPKDSNIVITIDPNPYKRYVIKDQSGNVIKDTANMPRPKPVFSRSNATIASIIADLKKEGLIKDEGEKFKWHLCNEKLEVNGVEQSPEILNKILTKYINPSIEHINIYYTCCD